MQTEEPDQRSGPVTLMRKNGAFRLLIAGSSVSVLGSRVTTIAYPLLVLYLTSSPATAGCVAFAATAPSLLVYIPVGALVDRWDPRRTMLISESCRGITIGIVAATLIRGRPSVALLIGAVVAEEIFKSFSMLAEPRYVCSVVEDDQEKRSVLASMEGRTHISVLAGRPLGALLFGFQHTFPFFFDSISFLFSIGTLTGIKGRPTVAGKRVVKSRRSPENYYYCYRPAKVIADDYIKLSLRPCENSVTGLKACRNEITGPSLQSVANLGKVHKNDFTRPYQRLDLCLAKDVGKAFHWLRSHPRATSIICLSASATLISQALIMIFLAAAHEQHLSAAMIGMILATSGIGGTAGAMVGSRLKAFLAAPRLEKLTGVQVLRAITGRPLIQIQLWAWTAAFTGLCILGGGSFFSIAAVMTILGFTGALSNIQFNTYLMTSVPKEMLARVTSVGNLVSLAGCAVGPAVGGLLIQHYETGFALNSLLSITFILAIISVGAPSMRPPRASSSASDSTAPILTGRLVASKMRTAEYPAGMSTTTRGWARSGFTGLAEERQQIQAQIQVLAGTTRVPVSPAWLPFAGDILSAGLNTRVCHTQELEVLLINSDYQAAMRVIITKNTLTAIPGIPDADQGGCLDPGPAAPVGDLSIALCPMGAAALPRGALLVPDAGRSRKSRDGWIGPEAARLEHEVLEEQLEAPSAVS